MRSHTGTRVALVVGDTAGHTYPAIAIAEVFEREVPGAHVMFFGTRASVATRILAQAGRPCLTVPGSPIRKASPLGLARAAVDSLRCVHTARRLLRAHDAHLALSFGSFVTGGVMLAARSLGLPTAILEANVEFGLANRWLRPWVDHVFRGLDADTGRGIGVPVRLTLPPETTTTEARPHTAPLRLLVASGSRGETFFSREVPRVCAAVQATGVAIEVWQQSAQPDALATTYAGLGIPARVEPFIADMANAYVWADVVIARAGASTISELALAGRPALLVPLSDASANHQHANAQLWQTTGAGLCLTETAWTTERVAAWVTTTARDHDARRAMGAAARSLARPAAAAEIVTTCMQLIEARR